jgi:signal transduction histidine kinase/CheY-like chemotaxis protein
MQNNKYNFNYSEIKDFKSLEHFWQIVDEELKVVSGFEESLFLIFDNGKLKDLVDNISINVEFNEESLLTTAINSSFPISINDIDSSFSYNKNIDNPLGLELSHMMIVPLMCQNSAIWSIVILYKISKNPFNRVEVDAIKEFLYKSNDILIKQNKHVLCQDSIEDKIDRQQEFFSSTIHDIRTPMNSIMGFLELLRLDESDIEKREYIDLALKSSETVATLINDVLDISKIEAGKLDINMQFVSIIQEFEDLSLLFSYMTSKKKIDFVTCYDPMIPYIIRTDISRIKQVIGNLLSNAIKFTPIGGYIEFKIKYDANIDTITISVKDNGIGVSKEQQKSIFKPFSQASKETSSQYGGTGLGLSISKELIKLLGGELMVESKEEEGSNFYFTLPCKSIPFTPETIDRDRFQDIPIYIFYPLSEIEQRVYRFICQYFKRLDIEYVKVDIDDIDILKESNIDNEVFILIDFQNSKKVGKFNQKRVIAITNTTLYKKYNNPNITPISQPLKLSQLFDNIENNIMLEEKIEGVKRLNKIYNILIIDDNMINLKLMGEIIKKLGHTPHLLDSGERALELIEREDINIAFIDQHMPDIDGDIVIKNIKLNPRLEKVSIYGLTGSSDKKVTNKMIEAGAISVLTKPIHINTIVDILSDSIRDR